MQSENADTESQVCRICYEDEPVDMLSPCKCKGSVANVHRACLKHWVEVGRKVKCELCTSEFKGIRLSVTQPSLMDFLQVEPLLIISILCIVVANCIDIYLVALLTKVDFAIMTKNIPLRLTIQTDINLSVHLFLGLMNKLLIIRNVPISVFINGPVTVTFVVNFRRMFAVWKAYNPVVVVLED